MLERLFGKVKSLISSPPPDSSGADLGEHREQLEKIKSQGLQSTQFVRVDFGGHFMQAIFSESWPPDALTNEAKLAAEAVADELKSPSLRQKAIPRLPNVVPQLLRSLRDPDASAEHFVSIITQDPIIASSVLKMANSAFYNPTRKEIDSFQRAVVILGIDGIRALLSSAVMQPIIHANSKHYPRFGDRLWQHAQACAQCCQILSRMDQVEPFKPYLAGLVHDIGKITVFVQLSNYYKLKLPGQKPSLAALIRLMDSIAPRLSYLIAKDWDFPEEILDALKDQFKYASPEEMSKLGQTLYFSNLVSEAHLLMSHGLLSREEGEQLLKNCRLPIDLYEQFDRLMMTEP